MGKTTILIAEDEGLLRETLTAVLTDEGFAVTAVTDGNLAIETLQAENIDVLLTDLQMPGLIGLELIKQLRVVSPETIAVVMTGFGTIATAVEVMKLGAFDYLTKPLINDELVLVIRKALAQRAATRRLDLYEYQSEQTCKEVKLIGESPVIRQVKEQVAQIAGSDATVLVTGASGTGKEVVAREIHRHGRRAAAPFVALNCASFQANLLASELFGHERGAFSGAVAAKKGLMELADGGTLFLDEIGDMQPELQAHLLRVLEERQFRRVGGTRSIEVDLRIITASNRKLEEEIARGNFREDLYFRINVITVKLPPLCERGKDIELIAEHVLRRLGQANRRPRMTLDPAARQRLYEYRWPGNVRELQNMLERACILCPDEIITPSYLALPETGVAPPAASGVDVSQPFKSLRNQVIEEFETGYLQQLVAQCRGNISEAARVAGLSRLALRDKLKKYGIAY